MLLCCTFSLFLLRFLLLLSYLFFNIFFVFVVFVIFCNRGHCRGCVVGGVGVGSGIVKKKKKYYFLYLNGGGARGRGEKMFIIASVAVQGASSKQAIIISLAPGCVCCYR